MRLTPYDVLRLLCCLLVLQHVVDGQSYKNVTSLKRSLLADYDTTMIPRNKLSDVVNVSISVNIFTIFDVDVVHGMLTTLAIVYATWTDERITWNSSDYDGLSMLKFPQNAVWTPNIATAKSLEMDDIGEAWMTVQYQPNGMAFWDPASTLKTACAFNVEFWPFDKHICNVDFFLYGTNYTEALLTTSTSSATLWNFIPHSEWEVEGTFAINKLQPDTSGVKYGLKLKRHATFYSLTIILPLIILNMFNCCVFLLPSDSGERISFSMTIMLSIVVFFLLVGDHVPKTSDPLPLICQFVGVIIGTACTSLLSAIFSLSVYFREDNVPEKSWGRRLVEMTRCATSSKSKVTGKDGDGKSANFANQKATSTVPFIQQNHQKGSSENVLDTGHPVNEKETGRNGDRNKGLFANRVDVMEIDVKRPLSVLKEEQIIGTLEWKAVSRAMDKVMFVIFLIATSIPSIVFPVYLQSASTYPEA